MSVYIVVMRLLDRYLLRQIITAMVFAVIILTAILVLGNIFRKLLDLLVDQVAPLETVVSFIAYVIPASSVYTIPWGFLTAVLLVFSRMSAENELLAMRTSGLSYLRIAAPVFILAGLLSLFCLWINVEVAPKAQERLQSSILSVATDNPVALFGSEQVIDQFPNKKIYVGRREGNRLFNLHVFELNEKSQPVRVISAREGELIADKKQRAMIMRLKDATFEQHDAADPGDFEKLRHGIRMAEVPIVVSLQEMYEKNQARRTLTVMTVEELMNQMDDSDGKRTKALTEFHKRFSFSLACLTLAAVGVPLGITTQRRETSAGFGMSLLVAFGYFMFIEIANSLRDNASARPHLIMWLPNILGLGLGIWLFTRLAKR